MILDGRLKHVQTLLGSDLGYGETPINCVYCAELVGKIAVTWGSDVVIFLNLFQISLFPKRVLRRFYQQQSL